MATIKKACKGVSYPKSSSVSKRLGSPSRAKNGKSFPDLNKDGKITKADILKGRGVIAKKGMTVKKAQDGFYGSKKSKNQMDANKNPTFNPSFTSKSGVTRTYETDTTGLAAGRKTFPFKKTISGTSKTAEKLKNKYPKPFYGTVDKTSVNKALSTQGGKQKNGGKTSKKK